MTYTYTHPMTHAEYIMSHLGMLFILLYLAANLIPVAQILHRTGYSRWLSLVSLVPLVNLICLWIFAFTEWPREVTELRTEEEEAWSEADKENFKKLLDKQRGA